MSQKILVIDDDRGVRAICGFILAKEGYDVQYASDGAEALAEIHKETFDLILLDIILPFVDGRHIAKLIRSKGVTTPIVLISSLPEEVVEESRGMCGANGYILKPYKKATLISEVKKALSGIEKD